MTRPPLRPSIAYVRRATDLAYIYDGRIQGEGEKEGETHMTANDLDRHDIEGETRVP